MWNEIASLWTHDKEGVRLKLESAHMKSDGRLVFTNSAARVLAHQAGPVFTIVGAIRLPGRAAHEFEMLMSQGVWRALQGRRGILARMLEPTVLAQVSGRRWGHAQEQEFRRELDVLPGLMEVYPDATQLVEEFGCGRWAELVPYCHTKLREFTRNYAVRVDATELQILAALYDADSHRLAQLLAGEGNGAEVLLSQDDWDGVRSWANMLRALPKELHDEAAQVAHAPLVCHVVSYHHRHGTDVWPRFVPAGSPPPSAEEESALLPDWEPELGESIEVSGPFQITAWEDGDAHGARERARPRMRA